MIKVGLMVLRYLWEILTAVQPTRAIHIFFLNWFSGIEYVRLGQIVHCSYPSRPLVKIITIYQPDPELWIDFKVRR